MHRANRAKTMIAALALAGAIGIGTNAFTASGLTNNAGSSQFLGGSVTQDVSGASLQNVAYAFADAPGNLIISEATLTFAGNANGQHADVTFHHGVSALNDVVVDAGTIAGNTATATISEPTAGVTGITVAVS